MSEESRQGRLEGRLIGLGVCGSIAAYKAVELLRRLTAEGADVVVMLTPAAARFVGPLTFAALSLVRDRRTGLFELMRVGPLSSIEIVIGKILAYVIVGSFVAAAINAAATVEPTIT